MHTSNLLYIHRYTFAKTYIIKLYITTKSANILLFYNNAPNRRYAKIIQIWISSLLTTAPPTVPEQLRLPCRARSTCLGNPSQREPTPLQNPEQWVGGNHRRIHRLCGRWRRAGARFCIAYDSRHHRRRIRHGNQPSILHHPWHSVGSRYADPDMVGGNPLRSCYTPTWR